MGEAQFDCEFIVLGQRPKRWCDIQIMCAIIYLGETLLCHVYVRFETWFLTLMVFNLLIRGCGKPH